MRTIKMVADELGVTKQTIVNNAKRLNISFEKENGINYINDNDYLKIIEKITKKERTTQNKESVKKELFDENTAKVEKYIYCLLYTSPSPRDKRQSRMPSSA